MEAMKEAIDKKVVDALMAANPSNRALAAGVLHILEKMWSEERLAEYIEAKHNSLCKACPKAKLSKKVVAVIGSLATSLVAAVGALLKSWFGGGAQ